jgi:hypothetical protein
LVGNGSRARINHACQFGGLLRLGEFRGLAVHPGPKSSNARLQGRNTINRAGGFQDEPAEMERLFRRYPEAVARTLEIAERCRFSLEELTYSYPTEVLHDAASR